MKYALYEMSIDDIKMYNCEYNDKCEEIENEKNKAILHIGSTKVFTPAYYALEERRKKLIHDECFDLEYYIENIDNYNKEILENYYLIDVDDSDLQYLNINII